MEFSIGTCRKVCKDLGLAVMPSFGPRGQLALILEANGQAILSSSGIVILDAAANNLQSPIAAMVNKATFRYHNANGDGSKIFILILGCLLESISKELPTNTNHFDEMQTRITLMRELHQIIGDVLPECFRKLRSGSVCQKFELESGIEVEQIIKVIKCLVDTFFTSKFSTQVSRILSNLLCNFISNSFVTAMSFPNALGFLVKNFVSLSTMCGEVSLSMSHVSPGMVISRDFRVHDVSLNNATGVKFIIVTDCGESYTKDVQLLLEDVTDVQKSVSWKAVDASAVVRHWRQNYIKLVLCKSTLPSSLETLCRLYKISIIVMVAPEQLEMLQMLAGVSPLESIGDCIEEENVGKLESVQTVLTGSKRFIHVMTTSNKTLDFVPQHLVLCGPTDTLCKQYFVESWNCLKVCFTSLSLTNPSAILVCPAGGCWEIEMAKVLKTINEPRYIPKMLMTALLSVPKALQGNSRNALRNELKLISSLEPVYIEYETASIAPANEALFFESVAMKERLLCNVCETLLQILCVGKILPVTSTKTTSITKS